VRNLLATLLRGLGYTILEANNSRKGLGLARGHTGPLHLIITDARRIREQRFLDAVRAVHPMVKVLYVPGPGDGPSVDLLRFEGKAEILQKSFTVEELLRKIRAILRQP